MASKRGSGNRSRTGQRGGASHRPPPGPSRKDLQLCAQVADNLHYLLSSAPEEELHDLLVAEVIPIAGSSQLLARVALPPNTPAERVMQTQLVLTACSRRFREEIASAITRRRAPELFFQVITASLRELAGEPPEEANP
jgi:ribosome-binding factor A